MDIAEIAGTVIGTICFLVWIPCMVSWIRRGVSIPRYMHVVALTTTCVGLGCVLWLASVGAVTLWLALALIGIPPAATYFGWFWLFGPELLPSESQD